MGRRSCLPFGKEMCTVYKKICTLYKEIGYSARKALRYNTFEWDFQNIPPYLPKQQKLLMRSSVLLIMVLFFVVADLKRICETEKGSLEITDDSVRKMLKKTGLATQCIQAENAVACNNVSLAQLCLKINSKMGGANNAIASNAITRLVSLPY